MVPNQLGHILHWLNLEPHAIGAPLSKHSADYVDLLAIQHGPQWLPVRPGPRGPFGGQLRDQGIQVRPLGQIELGAVPQPDPPQPFEFRILSLFEASGLVHGQRGMSDHMKLIVDDLGIGQERRYALDGGWRHIDAHRGDRLRGAAVSAMILGQGRNGLGILALRDEDDGRLLGIRRQGAILVAAAL